MMRTIASTISQVSPSKTRAWKDRVVLGCWAAKYLPLCAEYLPGYPISHIGFSTSYARQFLPVPNVSFNMLQAMLMGPIGASFIRDAKALSRPIFAWTVNQDKRMTWCIRKGLDGVISDDPKKFLEVCKDWEEHHEKEVIVWREWLEVIRINVFVSVFILLIRLKFGWSVDQRFVRRVSIQEER
jgi:glycerophosphoryl diester phosphodiesterase